MKKLITLLITVSVAFISCQRELSYSAKETGINKTVTDFHARNRKEVQDFTINTANMNVITGSKGAKLQFPPNGFVTQDGRPVSGILKVLLKEIYTPMEMILNNMPTTTDGRLLESGGEFQILVSQNNTAVKLAPNKFIKISIPNIGRDMEGMQVFNGVTDIDGKVNWVINQGPGNLVVRDSTLFANSELFSSETEWINCDKFINEPTVEFSVYPGNAPPGDSTNVFVHLTGRNTVVKMNWAQGLNYFNANMLLAVPSSIVGISTRNGELFASVSSVNIQNGGSVTMNFVPYSEQQLKDRLSKLH